MKINLTYDPTTVNATTLGSAAKLASFKAQVTAAADVFATRFLDPVDVNIAVKLGTTGLASVNQSYYAYTLATAKDALKKDVTSLDDLKTSGAVGAGAGTIYLTHAQLKALGLIKADAAGSDATVTFTKKVSDLDLSHSTAMSATSYDLFGVAAHEISEVMGRVADVASSSGVLPTVLTQFNSGGKLTIGTDSLLKFNTAATGDRGDWDSSVAAEDAFRAFASPGKVATISDADLRAVDVVGWDRRALDLVFAIDTTGSMGPYIDNVKANAIGIANAAFGTAAVPVDARIGIVGFKDAASPNGPGENTAILSFTEQDTYDARKTATVNAINAITVGGGGDTPEGDNSALLYALKGSLGDWRRAAQDHKIILFTDAPIKDTGLAAQVAAAAAALGATVTGGSIAAASGVTFGSFSFAAPSTALALDDGAPPGGDETLADSVLPGPDPETIAFSAEVYAIQVGSDGSATAGLTDLAASTGGQFFSGGSADLSEIIRSIILAPTFRIAASDADKPEGTVGPTPFTFTVSRSGDTSGTQTLHYVVAGAGDTPATADDFVGGALPSGDLTFLPDETSRTLTVNVAGDLTDEPDEHFTVTLSGEDGTNIPAPTASGVIRNDDMLVNLSTLAGDSFDGSNAAAEAIRAAAIAAAATAAQGAGPLFAVTQGAAFPPVATGYAEAIFNADSSGTVVLPAGYPIAFDRVSAPLALTGNGDAGQVVFATSGGLTYGFAGGGGLALTGNAADVLGRPPAGNLITLDGNAATVAAGSGADTILAGLGSHVIAVGAGSNVVRLGTGQDVVATEGSDSIQMGLGAATIAVSGNATVTGGSGTMLVASGAASATVLGGSGAETLFAGAGGGLFQGGGNGHNLLVAGAGNSTLIGAGGGNLLFGTAAGGGALLYAGSGSDTMVAGAGADTLVGSSRSLLFAGPGPSTVFGGTGEASMVGGTGRSLLVGPAGPATVFGAAGEDTVFAGGPMLFVAGSGTDLVVLGAGPGTFWSGPGTQTYLAINGQAGGEATIAGFEPGRDRLALSGYAPAGIRTTIAGSDTVVRLSDDTTITLLGVTAPLTSLF